MCESCGLRVMPVWAPPGIHPFQSVALLDVA